MAMRKKTQNKKSVSGSKGARKYRIKSVSVSRTLTREEAAAAKTAIKKKYPQLSVSIVNA